jgi:hypothetical protein
VIQFAYSNLLCALCLDSFASTREHTVLHAKNGCSLNEWTNHHVCEALSHSEPQSIRIRNDVTDANRERYNQEHPCAALTLSPHNTLGGLGTNATAHVYVCVHMQVRTIDISSVGISTYDD